MVFGDGTATDYVVGRHSSRPEFRSKGGGAILITGQAAFKMLHSTQDLSIFGLRQRHYGTYILISQRTKSVI